MKKRSSTYQLYIYKVLFLALGAALALTACSSDDEKTPQATQVRLQVMAADRRHAEVQTRALDTDHYESYKATGNEYNLDANGTNIFLRFLPKDNTKVTKTTSVKWIGDDEEFQNQGYTEFDYMWIDNFSLERDVEYLVAGYMPDKCTEEPVEWHECAENKVRFTLKNLNTASEHDLCAVVGVAGELKGGVPDIVGTTVPLEMGNFKYQPADEENNVLYLLMDHIYTRIRLRLTVGEEYNKLRRILLKEVKMVVKAGKVSVTVTVEKTAEGPKAEFTFHDMTGEDTQTLIFQSKTPTGEPDKGTLLRTDQTVDIPAFFAPINLDTDREFQFVFTYDVYGWYDYDEDGNMLDGAVPIREDATAQSKWILKKEAAQKLGPGKSYTLDAKVVPTYLYQLGDPDLNNPTVKLN